LNRPTAPDDNAKSNGSTSSSDCGNHFRFFSFSPDDMIPEVKSEQDGDNVHFIAAFGGKRNADGYLGVLYRGSGQD
jgi:hypothetical protein